MGDRPVRTRVEGRVGMLSFDRPEALNAFDTPLMEAVGTAMLAPWITGPKQAKELLLTGDDRISAERCLQMGVLNAVVDDGAELDAALRSARQIAGSAPRSVQLTKAAINQSYEAAGMRRALAGALETEILIESGESPERTEFNRIRKGQGLKAALAWRDARVSGD